jgi:hypothetical protein
MLFCKGDEMNFSQLIKHSIPQFRFIMILILLNGIAFGQGLTFTEIDPSVTHINNNAERPHGTYWADISGDGLPDLYITTYDATNSYDEYYENQGGFEFLSKTLTIGLGDYDGGSHGACWADLDNDGDYDLINGSTITDKSLPPASWVPARNNLYRNDTGTSFVDVTPVFMQNTKNKTRGVVAFDRNGNGLLDIFAVSGYEGSNDTRPVGGTPLSEQGEHPNEYVSNSGSWNLSAITTGELYDVMIGQGCTSSDFDNDTDVDMFAGNRTGQAQLLRNDGTGIFDSLSAAIHGIYLTSPAEIGVLAEGATLGDVDNDGDLDLLTVETEGAAAHLFKNELYNPIGSTGTLFSIDETWTNVQGYMGAFGDLDNDGDLDLIFAGYSNPILNDGVGNLSIASSITIPYTSMIDPRSIAFADIDNDGDLDFAVAGKNDNSYTHVIRNDLSNSNHWLKVKLISPQGQAGAFGAKVYVSPNHEGGLYEKRGGNLSQIGLREACGSFGYLGQNDPVLHFGLGSHTAVDVTVEYVCGRRAIRRNVAADQTITINGSDVQVALKVFLEGPYDVTGDIMRTDLKGYGFVPTTSPYSDLREVDPLPSNDVVDWIFVKLRRTSDLAVVDGVSALLRNDGMLVADDGVTEFIYMKGTSGQNYYIEVNHRNHLAVMSATAKTLSDDSVTTHDFTAAGQSYGTGGMYEIETGVWAMWAGDTDQTGTIDANDRSNTWNDRNKIGYKNSDCYLTGSVDANDRSVTWNNRNKYTQVP